METSLSARIDAHVEQGFQILDVLVVDTEQGFQSLGGSSIFFKNSLSNLAG